MLGAFLSNGVGCDLQHHVPIAIDKVFSLVSHSMLNRDATYQCFCHAFNIFVRRLFLRDQKTNERPSNGTAFIDLFDNIEKTEQWTRHTWHAIGKRPTFFNEQPQNL